MQERASPRVSQLRAANIEPVAEVFYRDHYAYGEKDIRNLLALKQRIPGAVLFAWAFALLPLTYYFITVQARFRHPLEPVICVLSVYLFQSADRSRTWSWRKTPSVTP